MKIAATAELDALKVELQRARQEAEQQKATVAKASKELAEEKVAHGKDQAQVIEVEDILKGVYLEHDTLQEDQKKAAAEFEKLKSAHAEFQSQARADHEVLQQVRQIAASKSYLLQCVFDRNGSIQLTHLWRSIEAFTELFRSASHAGCHYATQDGHSMERSFWQKFQTPSHPPLINDQTKKLMQLYCMVKPAIEDLCVHLWLVEPLPTSFFGLVARLQDAGPRALYWKWSACLEGAQMAYACVKTHYPRIDMRLMALGPPEGKARTPEEFMPDVMVVARITEPCCSQNTLYFYLALWDAEVLMM